MSLMTFYVMLYTYIVLILMIGYENVDSEFFLFLYNLQYMFSCSQLFSYFSRFKQYISCKCSIFFCCFMCGIFAFL